MAQDLPQVTALNSNLLAVEERPIQDEIDQDGPGYLSAHGPHHDKDHLNLQDVQILLTTDEVLAVRRPPYIPKKDIQEPNVLGPGPQRLLDMLFRHLRFESVEGIRDISYHAAAQHLLKQTLETTNDYELRQETKSGSRYFLYKDAVGRKERSDTAFELPVFTFHAEMGHDSIRLFGTRNAFCSCLSRERWKKSFNHIFRSTHDSKHEFYESEKWKRYPSRRAAVQLAFTRPAKSDNVRRVLRYAQGLSSRQYVLVEFPKLLYAGFYHCLHTLQQIQSTDIAFTRYIPPRNASLLQPTRSMSICCQQWRSYPCLLHHC